MKRVTTGSTAMCGPSDPVVAWFIHSVSGITLLLKYPPRPHGTPYKVHLEYQGTLCVVTEHIKYYYNNYDNRYKEIDK